MKLIQDSWKTRKRVLNFSLKKGFNSVMMNLNFGNFISQFFGFFSSENMVKFFVE